MTEADARPILAALEEQVQKQGKRRRTEAAILGTLALVGVMSVAALAPNVVGALAKFVPQTTFRSHQQSVSRTIGRLIREGCIEQTDGRYRITPKGENQLAHLTFSSNAAIHAPQKRWDGKWRIVLFDVKESRKTVRDTLRIHLARAGFVKLQGSVWVHPYPCDEVVALLKLHLTLGWNLLYVIADAIEVDVWLRQHFGLPPARA